MVIRGGGEKGEGMAIPFGAGEDGVAAGEGLVDEYFGGRGAAGESDTVLVDEGSVLAGGEQAEEGLVAMPGVLGAEGGVVLEKGGEGFA